LLSYQELLYKVYEDGNIETILDALGCHSVHFEQGGNLIVGARPDGDNRRSVQIKNIDNLRSSIRSRGIYGNIYSVIEYINDDYNTKHAYDFIMGVCGYTKNTKFMQTPLQRLNRIKRQRALILKHNKLNSIDINILNQYIYGDIKQFTTDGISLEVLKEYDIGYDVTHKRITIPVYSIDGELCGIKGRTVDNIKNIKFLYLYRCNQSKTLFNYHRSKNDCILDGEVCILESEKGCMQAKTFEVYNTMGLGSSGISYRQLNILLELKVDIVLCYDEGVDYNTITKTYINFFKGKRNVYVMYDKNNILKSKESPTDNGREIWDKLYEQKTKIC